MDDAYQFLRRAAQQLRDVAPNLHQPFSGLADPVAAWLDETAREAEPLGTVNERAMAVARAILGEQP